MRILTVLCLICLTTKSLQAQYEEGLHYHVVSETGTEQPTITEFFSFFCGHCYQFEPLLEEFKNSLPQGTKFERSHVNYIPRDNEAVSFGMVKAFIIMQKLENNEELSRAFFDHIHKAGNTIGTVDEIKALFLAHGVNKRRLNRYFNSRKVTEGASRMAASWQEKQIRSVPTLVVNGKYRINMESLKNIRELSALANYLLQQ